MSSTDEPEMDTPVPQDTLASPKNPKWRAHEMTSASRANSSSVWNHIYLLNDDHPMKEKKFTHICVVPGCCYPFMKLYKHKNGCYVTTKALKHMEKKHSELCEESLLRRKQIEVKRDIESSAQSTMSRPKAQEESEGLSLEDTLASLVTLPQLLKKRKIDLDKREEELSLAERGFAEDTGKVGLYGSAKPSDVLNLSLGGRRVSVLRRTLCYADGSMLASKFSGRWDDTLEKDTDGNFFIDQPAHLFESLIDFFRASANVTPNGPPVKICRYSIPKPSHTIWCDLDFMRMVEYYGCTPVVYPTEIRLHSGVEGSAQIKQYPEMTIKTDAWSTFVLKASGHNRYIKSYQIEVGDIDRLLVGLFDIDYDLSHVSSNSSKGTGEIGTSIALDCCSSDVVRCNANDDVERIKLTEKVKISNGSVVKVVTKGTVGNRRGLESISVDGNIVASDGLPGIEEWNSGYGSTLWPAFSGKGTMRVAEIVLGY
eukprot:CAMPEP_0194388164 /NCGR_PEP_ID=MMETSP0174-20130528/96799_1 /TAXON_ID=216777 /ORGANISM="Proboscia alata, Strain PI-D3" /LENGTH=482 /DNA_ID=CAMNT_0039179133 /DNA_START=189 /DNA_END=1637 /DNA_ORIENTATION=-